MSFFEASILHFLEDIGHIFDVGPDLFADIDGGVLLDGDCDAVAWAGVEFDDFFVVEFILCPEDEAGVVDSILKVVDDDPFDGDAEGEEEVADEVVSLRPFLWGMAHEHCDGGSDVLVDVNDENLVVVPDEDGASAAGGEDGADLDFDDEGGHPLR